MVVLILHVYLHLCVSFSKCLCGLCLCMYVYGCVCTHVRMRLQRHIHGIMSCRAGRCQGIWLRRNCSAVVISVFLVGITLKTKNDWKRIQTCQHGPLGSHSPQHENIGCCSTVRNVMVSLCCDRVCEEGRQWKKAPHRAQHYPASSVSPREIST